MGEDNIRRDVHTVVPELRLIPIPKRNGFLINVVVGGEYPD